MSEVHTVTFKPTEGQTVELPEAIGRIDIDRVGSPKMGYGALKIAVTGQGDDMKEFVLLKHHGDSADLEGDAQILGTDLATGDLWYAVPIAVYRSE